MRSKRSGIRAREDLLAQADRSFSTDNRQPTDVANIQFGQAVDTRLVRPANGPYRWAFPSKRSTWSSGRRKPAVSIRPRSSIGKRCGVGCCVTVRTSPAARYVLADATTNGERPAREKSWPHGPCCREMVLATSGVVQFLCPSLFGQLAESLCSRRAASALCDGHRGDDNWYTCGRELDRMLEC